MKNTTTEQNQLITVSLLVIAAVCFTAALVYTRSVMVPFVLALLISHLVMPLIDGLERHVRAPRWFAMVLAFAVICGSLVLLVLLLTTSIAGLASNASLYQERTVSLATKAFSLLDKYNIDFGQEAIVDGLKNLPVFQMVTGAAGSLINFISNTVLVMIFAAYLVTGRSSAGSQDGIRGEMDQKVRRYLAAKVGTSAVTGILVGLVLWGLGLDLALVFGVLAFLLNFIPSIGSVISTLLPLPIALFQFQNPSFIVLAIALPGAIQMVVGNIVEPKIMGDHLDLHPVTILLTLIFWGLIWGLVGMLLATPMTAVLKIVLQQFDTTRPVAEILAGRIGDSRAAGQIPEPS